MIVWQRPVRMGLASFAVAFGIAVIFGIRDRSESGRAVIVDRTDPDAIIQTRGTQIVQADASTENVRIVAGGSSTYADGVVRLIDGVTMTAAARTDRDGFTMTGNEAEFDDEAGDVHLTGSVRFRSGDGLEAAGAEAFYSDTTGVVQIPGAAEFTRRGMRAFGESAQYNRRHDLLHLQSKARVELTGEGSTDPSTEIRSDSATLAESDGYMDFVGGVTVLGDRQTMESDAAHATFVAGTSHLELMELKGDSRVMGNVREPGRLQEMTASDMTLSYRGDNLDGTELADGAEVQFFGRGGAPGARIAGRVMDVTLEPDGIGISELNARESVVVTLPRTEGGVTQEIRAETFTVTGSPGAGLTDARFDRAVEYGERRSGADGKEPTVRTTRSQRLEATLAEGLAGLEVARFVGDVLLEDGNVTGKADVARYALNSDTFVLETLGTEGARPEVIDKRGSVRADSITINLEGPTIGAQGDVRSILTTTESDGQRGGVDDSSTEGKVRRPGLLAAGPPTLVTAGSLSYDAATSVATYAQGARLWQGDTEFQGDTIVLDEVSGDISADGMIRTSSIMIQNNDETKEPEESTTTGVAESVHYDEALQRARYTTATHWGGEALCHATGTWESSTSELLGPRGDLKATTIDVYLKEDAKTLDRLEAEGTVTLELSGRWVSGTTLTYYDTDGRYEMEGRPVRIIEEIDDLQGTEVEGSAGLAPAAENMCRETTGRTLTFFITEDAVLVDGQSETRTETTSGSCNVLLNLAPTVQDTPTVPTPTQPTIGR